MKMKNNYSRNRCLFLRSKSYLLSRYDIEYAASSQLKALFTQNQISISCNPPAVNQQILQTTLHLDQNKHQSLRNLYRF